MTPQLIFEKNIDISNQEVYQKILHQKKYKPIQ